MSFTFSLMILSREDDIIKLHSELENPYVPSYGTDKILSTSLAKLFSGPRTACAWPRPPTPPARGSTGARISSPLHTYTSSQAIFTPVTARAVLRSAPAASSICMLWFSAPSHARQARAIAGAMRVLHACASRGVPSARAQCTPNPRLVYGPGTHPCTPSRPRPRLTARAISIGTLHAILILNTASYFYPFLFMDPFIFGLRSGVGSSGFFIS